MLMRHILQFPWDMYRDRQRYKGLKGAQLFSAIVFNEEVVVTDLDRVHFDLDAQAERFVLAVRLISLIRSRRRVLTMEPQALDKDDLRRPTPVQLARHAFYNALYVLLVTVVLNSTDVIWQ